MGVIHFGDLGEMIGELLDGHTVRVEVLDVTEGVSKDYGIRQAGIGVHVRAFADEPEIVLACYVPVARLQMMSGAVLSDPGGGKEAYSTAWEKAEAEADRMREYLTGLGFDVRPGVIEIGDVRPLAGGWSGSSKR